MMSEAIVSMIHPVGGPALRRHLLDLLAGRMAAAALTADELIGEAARLESYVIGGAAPAPDGESIPVRNLFEGGAGPVVDCAPNARALYGEPLPTPAKRAADVLRKEADGKLLELLRAAAADGLPCPDSATLGKAVGWTASRADGAILRMARTGVIKSIAVEGGRVVSVDGRWTAKPDGTPWVQDGETPAPMDEAQHQGATPAPAAPVAVEPLAAVAPEPARPASLEQRLLAVLTDVIARGRSCPKNRELEDMVGATESDVAKAMTSLRADGRIVIERRGNLRRIGIGGEWTPWPDAEVEARAERVRAMPAEDAAPASRPAVQRVDPTLVEEVFQRIAAAAVDEAPFPAIADMAELIGQPKLDVQRAVDELKTSERISVEWEAGRCRACVEGLWTDWSETSRPRAVA